MRRLASLDFMRGLIMVLLALESTALYEHFFEASENSILNSFFVKGFYFFPSLYFNIIFN